MNFKPNENFKYYMYFIQERMNIFWNKYNNVIPYTNDPILSRHKFTNVYRVLDRSSQYLLQNVIYNGKEYTDEEMFMRILIYKHFNLPSTWDHIIKELGDFDSTVRLEDISECVKDLVKSGKKVYSHAYMITAAFLAGSSGKYNHLKGNGWNKFEYYFYIFDKEIISTGFINSVLESKTYEELFLNLKSITSFSDFLSYQITQDLNYSNLFNFDDNEFCVCGDGTIRGIERCFDINGKVDYPSIVKWVHSNFKELLNEYKIDFKTLPNHLPMVPDLSNCFCETDKYLRGLGIKTGDKEIEGKRIKSIFEENNEKINFIFPPKWNIKI